MSFLPKYCKELGLHEVPPAVSVDNTPVYVREAGRELVNHYVQDVDTSGRLGRLMGFVAVPETVVSRLEANERRGLLTPDDVVDSEVAGIVTFYSGEPRNTQAFYGHPPKAVESLLVARVEDFAAFVLDATIESAGATIKED